MNARETRRANQELTLTLTALGIQGTKNSKNPNQDKKKHSSFTTIFP
jgi:hypothetical protein